MLSVNICLLLVICLATVLGSMNMMSIEKFSQECIKKCTTTGFETIKDKTKCLNNCKNTQNKNSIENFSQYCNVF